MDFHARFPTVCALRFDGYAYAERTGRELHALTEPVVATLTAHADTLDNFAAFFALQRYIGKWGGERTLPTSRLHRAFWMLCFHLYAEPVPSAFVSEEHSLRWRREFLPDLEAHAAPFRRGWKRFLKLERELAAQSAVLTPNGALHVTGSNPWPSPGCCYQPDMNEWRPTVFPAAEGVAHELAHSGKRRGLTRAEIATIQTEEGFKPVRRYFRHLKTKMLPLNWS